MFDYFLDETPWEIREQILRYNATQNMSDVERANFFKLSKGCRMREGAKIISPEKLKIGVNCWIGENAILDASGGLEIGDNTSIGLTVFVWSHDSHIVNLSGENTRENSYKIVRKQTKIGDNCFIAGPSVVMPGVTIGNKCIISPLSVVYHDLPDNTVYKPYKKMYDLMGKNFAAELERRDNKIKELESRMCLLENAMAK